MRREAREITKLVSARMDYELAEGQHFCETDKAYKVWQEKPLLRRVARISKQRVLWVLTN